MNAILLLAAAVSVNVGTETIPTYTWGGFEKNPIFYFGRIYQGAQGRVYPYPLHDVLRDKKEDVEYRTVRLENDWLSAMVLPDVGGHLFALTDRDTGYEVFYRQHVIKPALIGMLGSWISGGVEWNFPHHHRASTFMPVDYTVTEQSDGSKTVWVGETELRHRMKWSIGLSMARDRACLVAENRFMNRQPYIESMLYWANVAVHSHPEYQVLFPPSCHLGFDHHKASWTTFPVGPKRTPHDWVPPAKYGVDDEADLSMWKNITSESRSIFAMDPDNAWLAGYDHAKNAGTIHLSNRHITVGKKFFLWGNLPEGYGWDKVLTDQDGPYIELMVGCWSDNQPDYSWIGPYETRTVKQYWYPVKGLGGVKNVTIEGCVNVERKAKDQMFVGFNSTTVQKEAIVSASANGREILRETIDIDPNHPWTKTITVDSALKDQDFSVALTMKNGKPIVAYSPVPAKTGKETALPAPVKNPIPPEEMTSAEELYLQGLRLEQFHNGLVDPIPYYEEALRRDPGYSAAHIALGIRRAREAKWSVAEQHLKAAFDRVTMNYTRAKDAEPEYLLGVIYAEQGRLKEAEDFLWRATWRDTYKREAFAELARVACRRHDWQDALARANDAIANGAEVAKFYVIKAFALRKLGRKGEAGDCIAQAVACDPLEYWGALERGFLNDATDPLAMAEQNRGLKAQQLLESIYDYIGLGAWDEVIALARLADARAAKESVTIPDDYRATRIVSASYRSPLFDYAAAYASWQKGDENAAREFCRLAGEQPTDFCFPSRHEELAILKMATEKMPEAANSWYYLGEVLWHLEHRSEGIAAWQKCIAINPRHSLALRNLGFACGRTPATREQALAFYDRALEADPLNSYALLERDTLMEKMARQPSERLARMTALQAAVDKYDPCLIRMAYLKNQTGDPTAALKILLGRRFLKWEDGEEMYSPFRDAVLLRGLMAADKGDYKAAVEDLAKALTYPDSLQAARQIDGGWEPKAHWFLARVRKVMGDERGWRQELEACAKDWTLPGEMNFYRADARRSLGTADAENEDLEQLDAAIAKLEAPAPKVVYAYAKASLDQTPEERAADRVWNLRYLKAFRAWFDGRREVAHREFAALSNERPSHVWARRFAIETKGE